MAAKLPSPLVYGISTNVRESHLGEVTVVQAAHYDSVLAQPPAQQGPPCFVPNGPSPSYRDPGGPQDCLQVGVNPWHGLSPGTASPQLLR